MGKITRRTFLGSAASSVLVAATATGEVSPPILPWEREKPLREAARSVFIEKTLDPSDPLPDRATWPEGRSMAITNPALKSSVWGPPHRITISMLKTDVQDRRVKWPPVVTLQEIREGAFSPANQDDIPVRRNTTRPVCGYLLPGGGRREPYFECWNSYPFPCQKPVGQIILMLDELQGGPAPVLRQNCANGLVRFQVERAGTHADLEMVLSMTRNLYAFRAAWTGLTAPVRLRLYRHQDQAHLQYMTPDGKFRRIPFAYNNNCPPGTLDVKDPDYIFDYEPDAAWNGPIEPPESGHDGRYFWIQQRMPPEKTFPQGFHYVMMGRLARPSEAEFATVNGQIGLGTPPYSPENWPEYAEPLPSPGESIRNAPGAAATATFTPRHDQKMTAYVVIVSEIDASDFMAEARRRLDRAEADGFDRIVEENTKWYGELYDRRERGRVFYGGAGTEATEDVREVYSSWFCIHGGGCKTDMRRYQASAPYSLLESDFQPWHGYPCYNDGIEFYTAYHVRNRSDAPDMWKQLVEHWYEASCQNAHDMYGMPGMALLHGYLPPIKADKYVHTSVMLELCVDTMAQVMKRVWEEWDYGGDRKCLEDLYPMMRDMAIFYSAYASKGDDGHYHVIPSMEAERWGIYPKFSHSKDTTGTLCMCRWALLRAAEAAELLGRDAEMRSQWRQIAGLMAPYATWQKPEGLIFAGTPGVEPFWFPGDHEYQEAVYPTTLGDELTLDSNAAEKTMMLRTARVIKEESNAEVLVLLGACPDTVADVRSPKQQPIADWKTLRSEVIEHPERLLNSRSGRIHLFPCVPAGAVVAFRRFQARGGFLVSAARNEQGVYFVEIESRRDLKCSVMNPWPGKRVIIRERGKQAPIQFRLDQTNGECLVFAASAGRSYDIQRA